ncbi:UDP-N-acetylmuramoyl-tripeptide--D-alanyl-D-alanine ligase [Salinithrix halophila]
MEALKNNPPAAIILPNELPLPPLPTRVAVIRVPRASSAVWRLALWNWKQMKVPVIGITGSTGKSTTTTMVDAILKQTHRVVRTHGNLNTFFYLPTYLLRLSPADDILLLEMGMSSLHNIARQCQVVRPHVGVVTNVGEAHVGSLGGLDQVVRAKQEMIDGVRPGGILFLNADCSRSQQLSTRHFQGTICKFGIDQPADIQGEELQYTKEGMRFYARVEGRRLPFRIPLFGEHNVSNALAAIGVVRSLGVPFPAIQRGLARMRPLHMRFQVIQGRQRRTLINDAWNASPSAMQEGLSVLKKIAGNQPAIAVLGDMHELGQYSRFAHTQIGKQAASLNLDGLITFGSQAKAIASAAIANGLDSRQVTHFTNRRALIRFLSQAPENAILYFKASRKLHFERIVQRLT